jgi:hypothetical protein
MGIVFFVRIFIFYLKGGSFKKGIVFINTKLCNLTCLSLLLVEEGGGMAYINLFE